MRVAVLLVTFLLPLAPVALAEKSPEMKSTVADLTVIDALIMKYWEEEDIEVPSSPITLLEFSKDLPPEIARRIPTKDGWGQDFMMVARGHGLFVSSAGQNGRHDLLLAMSESELEEEGYEEPFARVIGDDIVLSVGDEIMDGKLEPKEKQKRAMADLRSIGTSIESYSIDNNVYPVQDRDLLPIKTIQEDLSPIYIRRLPLVDAWGNEFLMWGIEGEYCVMSLGADGRFDQYYNFPQRGSEGFPFGRATSRFDADIVFCNGQFVQWPEGTQQ